MQVGEAAVSPPAQSVTSSHSVRSFASGGEGGGTPTPGYATPAAEIAVPRDIELPKLTDREFKRWEWRSHTIVKKSFSKPSKAIKYLKSITDAADLAALDTEGDMDEEAQSVD